MKKIFLYLFLGFFINISNSNSTEAKYPFDQSNTKEKYELDNGNIIIIEKWGRGDRIWEQNIKINKFKKIASVWSFIALAKECEGIKEKNIYFAQNLEYWLGGGAKIDNAQIRIFNLYDPSPWRDSDLGIVKNIEHVKNRCTFYNTI